MELVEKKITTSRGYSLCYVSTPPDDTHKHIPILFVHGFGGDAFVWKDVISHLAKKDIPCIAIDLPGSGFSDRLRTLGDYSFDLLAHDIIDVLEYEGLKRVLAVGHSMGGMIVQRCLFINEKLFSGVILVSTTDTQHFWMRLLQGSFFCIHKIALFIGLTGYQKARRNHRVFDYTWTFSPRRIISDIFHTSVPSYFAYWYYISNFFNANDIVCVKIPALLVYGEKDRIVPFTVVEKMNNNILNSSLVTIPHALHTLLNNPMHRERLSDIIGTFYRKVIQ